jgi:hypothetical protein
MFNSTELKSHLQTSSTIENQSLVLAEWNLNIAENIKTIGNYRFKPLFETITPKFVEETSSTPNPKYWGATDFDVTVNGGQDENGDPVIFTTGYNRLKSLFSLEDCFNRFRPRSGINKAIWFDDDNGVSAGRFFSEIDQNVHNRPRYYMGSPDDSFKYWTSYRMAVLTGSDGKTPIINPQGLAVTEERGRSYEVEGNNAAGYLIDDAVPFVVYKNPVPTNKIVVKIQTHTGVGDGSAKSFKNRLTGVDTPDPFFADSNNRANMKVPKEWRIQGLYGDTWKTLKSNDVTPTDLVLNETSIGNDGYLELLYGLIVPTKFKDNFKIAETYTTTAPLPDKSIVGYAYLVKAENTRGEFYVWNGGTSPNKLDNYDKFTPSYSWRLGNQDITAENQYVIDLTSPDNFVSNSETVYREFQYISGLRIVVSRMLNKNSTFDLIELSPRLSADISDRVSEFQLNKIASDIGNSGLPVGQLLVSNGSISIFDFDQAFNSNNTNSIVSGFASKNLQLKFYDVVSNVTVGQDIKNFYVPIKTMYSDGFQDSSSNDRSLSIDLRDLYFYFESMIAPQVLFPEVSLSRAISFLLDSIGFSNYTFKRLDNENDPTIPYFFVSPNTSVAQVLNDLAVSTQAAMFFDEYNNFVVMTKEYMLPEKDKRSVDLEIIGTPGSGELSNIIEIADKNSEIYNDGKITYSSRYIQKSIRSLNQASQLDEDRSYGYQPVLLWEVSPSQNIKSQNEVLQQQSGYALTAIPLETTLSTDVPTVSSNYEIINNTISLGSSVYWLPRYDGYLYAGGEVIKFDAIQYNLASASTPIETVSIEKDKFSIIIQKMTRDYKVGQKVSKVVNTEGNGVFGNNAKIQSIKTFKPADVSGSGITDMSIIYTEIILDTKHAESGAITFSAAYPENSIWISSVEEYQNQFAKIPFGGKLYPTGKVRIYCEPNYEDYNPSTSLVDPVAANNTATRLKQGAVIKHGRGQFGTPVVEHIAGIPTYWKENSADSIKNGVGNKTIFVNSNFLFSKDEDGKPVSSVTIPATTIGLAGDYNKNYPEIRDVISNALSSTPSQEDAYGHLINTKNGSIKSSALTIKGPYFTSSTEIPTDYISYVYKEVKKVGNDLPLMPTAFGARLRIVGRTESGSNSQTPDGISTYYTRTVYQYDPLTGKDVATEVNVGGGSGGISVLLDKDTNNGYFFEIMALSQDVSMYAGTNTPINNVMFYKIKKNAKSGTKDTDKAIAVPLWSGLAPITVDDGKFTGQSRVLGEQNPTVYDLAIEYTKNGRSKTFDLYINGNIVAIVTDPDSLPDATEQAYGVDGNAKITTNPVYIGMFARGSSNVMFENVYAIGKNPKFNPSFGKDAGHITKDGKVIEEEIVDVNTTDSVSTRARALISGSGPSTDIKHNLQFDRYTIPGPLKNTLISSISPKSGGSEYSVWFEEFGTIMREAAYFKVKYDKAFPSLYSIISPTFNNMCGYSVSQFTSDPYGAEFMVFNVTDSVLSLDSASGNYLRIQGIAFTQESQHELTVDEFFKDRALSSTGVFDSGSLINPKATKQYMDIKNSRTTYGKKAFSLEPKYIQDQDTANKMMDWIIKTVSKPRKSVGIKMFSNPMLQLGDLVTIKFNSNNGTSSGADDFTEISNSKFVIYHISYSRSSEGPEMIIYLSEAR